MTLESRSLKGWLFLAVLAAAGSAWGQSVSSSTMPAALGQVGIDQKLGDSVPLDLTFRDERGVPVQLNRYFGRKPVVLTLVYYECPMLCTQVLNNLAQTLRLLEFSAGQEFEVVTVSINPLETPALAAAKKEHYLQHYARPGAAEGWHFLTGDQEPIRRLSEAVGFRYDYDPETGLFAHASVIMVLTPDGKLARYFYGIDYPARDLRLGLIDASEGQIGSAVDHIMLFCYQYDPTTGRYGMVIMNSLRLAGVMTVLGLGTFIVLMIRRERSRAPEETT